MIKKEYGQTRACFLGGLWLGGLNRYDFFNKHIIESIERQTMFQYLEEKTPAEAENIKKVIQDLFRQTCILQTKVDPITLVQKDNPRYQVCNRNREFITDYLAVLGCELVHDPQERIFRMAGMGVLSEHMNLLTTKILVLMKMIYHDKIMGSGLHATLTNLAEIREHGKDTNLLNRKLTGQEWQEALTLMKTHQIIDFPGAIRDMEDDTPIYIYPTINIFLNTSDIVETIKKYQQDEVQEPEEIDEAEQETFDEDLSE